MQLFNIPNLFTLINLFAGCMAILFVMGGNPEATLLCTEVSLVADFFDGMSARALKVSSGIGKELDSLADVVSFGVVPGFIFKFLFFGTAVELNVQGHLEAVGTATQLITFTSATNTGSNQWAGMVFDGGTGDLDYVTVRYGGRPNSINPTNQSQKVLFEVDNADGDFKIGEFVNVRIFEQQTQRKLLVSNSAFTEISGVPAVFVKESADATACTT